MTHVFSLLLFACATRKLEPKPEPLQTTFAKVKRIVLLTDGIQLSAEDGSFSLAVNEVQRPSFTQGGECLIEPRAQDAQTALAAGAKKVRIILQAAAKRRFSAKQDEYYGLLSLCGTPDSAAGPAALETSIDISLQSFQAIDQGRIGVVFADHVTRGAQQSFQLQGSGVVHKVAERAKPEANESYAVRPLTWVLADKVYAPKSWILWISATPFAATEKVGEAFSSAQIAQQFDALPLRYWQQRNRPFCQQQRRREASIRIDTGTFGQSIQLQKNIGMPFFCEVTPLGWTLQRSWILGIAFNPFGSNLLSLEEEVQYIDRTYLQTPNDIDDGQHLKVQFGVMPVVYKHQLHNRWVVESYLLWLGAGLYVAKSSQTFTFLLEPDNRENYLGGQYQALGYGVLPFRTELRFHATQRWGLEVGVSGFMQRGEIWHLNSIFPLASRSMVNAPDRQDTVQPIVENSQNDVIASFSWQPQIDFFVGFFF